MRVSVEFELVVDDDYEGELRLAVDEAAMLLQRISYKIETRDLEWGDEQKVMDVNGNSIGVWKVEL